MVEEMPMTRARLYVLIDAFERDIRAILSRFILPDVSAEEALGPYYAAAADRQAQDPAASSSPVDYLYLREGYDLLNTHRRSLPEELSAEVRQLTANLDRLVSIRQRVMHARPLQAGDSDATVSLLNLYETRYWSELKRMLAQLQQDPTWEPVVTMTSDAGYALHNLPLPDYDETGLIGRSKETEDLVRLIKRRREPILTITGEGGIGKSALAIEVAYKLVDDVDRLFDAVLWTSLKFEKLTAAGVRTIAGAARDIAGAANPIGQALDSSFEGTLDELAQTLEGLSVLLVVDNLETVGGSEFQTLYDTLPDTVSYLTTSRVGIGEFERRYPLQPLSREDSLRLFNNFVRARKIAGLERISGDTRIEVVTRLRHSPLAIKWFALAVEAGNDPLQLISGQDELLEFCVRSVYDMLESPARDVLDSLAILGRPVSVDELVLLLDRSTDHINIAIQELLRGSLIRRETNSPGDLTMRISVTETAQMFLARRAKPKPDFEQRLKAKEREYRTIEERRAVDIANRILAPVVVRTRTPTDSPVAQILRRALQHSSAGNIEGAIAEVEVARRLNPDFWEVDRVEGFIRSQNGNLNEATACFHRAYSNSEGEHRGVVAHFFAGHLARRVRDMNLAIQYAREAHTILKLNDTAVALGNYLVWARSFTEGIALMEPASVGQTGKARLIAITSIADSYRRWAEHTMSEERNPVLAYARAKRGSEISLAAIQSGVSDFKLNDKAVMCIVEGLRAATSSLSSTGTASGLAQWLESITSSLVRFENSSGWSSLMAESQRLAKTVGAPAAAKKLAEAATSLSRPQPSDSLTNDLVGEIVNLQSNYGFLRHPAYPNNVFFHRDDVIAGGFGGLTTGSLVRFSVLQRDRGPKAVDIGLIP